MRYGNRPKEIRNIIKSNIFHYIDSDDIERIIEFDNIIKSGFYNKIAMILNSVYKKIDKLLSNNCKIPVYKNHLINPLNSGFMMNVMNSYNGIKYNILNVKKLEISEFDEKMLNISGMIKIIDFQINWDILFDINEDYNEDYDRTFDILCVLGGESLRYKKGDNMAFKSIWFKSELNRDTFQQINKFSNNYILPHLETIIEDYNEGFKIWKQYTQHIIRKGVN